MTKPENRALWLAAVLFFPLAGPVHGLFHVADGLSGGCTRFQRRWRGPDKPDSSGGVADLCPSGRRHFENRARSHQTLDHWALALQTLGWMMIPLAGYASIGLASLIVWGIAAGLTPTSLWALPSTLSGRASRGNRRFRGRTHRALPGHTHGTPDCGGGFRDHRKLGCRALYICRDCPADHCRNTDFRKPDARPAQQERLIAKPGKARVPACNRPAR